MRRITFAPRDAPTPTPRPPVRHKRVVRDDDEDDDNTTILTWEDITYESIPPSDDTPINYEEEMNKLTEENKIIKEDRDNYALEAASLEVKNKVLKKRLTKMKSEKYGDKVHKRSKGARLKAKLKRKAKRQLSTQNTQADAIVAEK